MQDIAILTILALLCVVALLMTAVRLPGTWLIVAAALGFGFWTGWQRMSVWIVVALGVAALVGEIMEMATSAVAARKAGATRQAVWGGLSGATPAEAVSWGKVNPARLPDTVVAYCDSTIAFPLFCESVIGSDRGRRPRKALMQRREALVADLKRQAEQAREAKRELPGS